MTETQPQIVVVPLRVGIANELIQRLHRHHGPLPVGLASWSLGAIAEQRLVGIAVGGRPTNRESDDGQTIEVLRIATDGTPNAPSALLGACARTAKAMGARRIITYTLQTESGVSLRAAGWTREKDGIRTDWLSGTPRAIRREHMTTPKVRWAVHFRDFVPYEEVAPTPQMEGQASLFYEARRP